MIHKVSLKMKPYLEVSKIKTKNLLFKINIIFGLYSLEINFNFLGNDVAIAPA